MFCFSSERWTIDTETIQWLAAISDGDARIALNSLQMAIQSATERDAPAKTASSFRITLSDIENGIKVIKACLDYVCLRFRCGTAKRDTRTRYSTYSRWALVSRIRLICTTRNACSNRNLIYCMTRKETNIIIRFPLYINPFVLPTITRRCTGLPEC